MDSSMSSLRNIAESLTVKQGGGRALARSAFSPYLYIRVYTGVIYE